MAKCGKNSLKFGKVGKVRKGGEKWLKVGECGEKWGKSGGK